MENSKNLMWNTGKVTNLHREKGQSRFLICFPVIFKEHTVGGIAHFMGGGFLQNKQITRFFNLCFDGSLDFCRIYQL